MGGGVWGMSKDTMAKIEQNLRRIKEEAMKEQNFVNYVFYEGNVQIRFTANPGGLLGFTIFKWSPGSNRRAQAIFLPPQSMEELIKVIEENKDYLLQVITVMRKLNPVREAGGIVYRWE